MIDDDLLRMLMTGLVHNQTITHLDLSHNKITNHGVRLLSKIIGSKSVVMSLNLCDNQIHKDGGKCVDTQTRACTRTGTLATLTRPMTCHRNSPRPAVRAARANRYLGRALKRNDSLIDLNLRLNRLDDEGGRMLFEGLRNNASVTSLNVCSNAMQGESAKAMAVCLSNPDCALVSVDMSGNRLNEADADVSASAVQHAACVLVCLLCLLAASTAGNLHAHATLVRTPCAFPFPDTSRTLPVAVCFWQLIKDALQENVALTALDLRANPDVPAASDALSEILRTTRRNELHQRKLAQQAEL